MYLFQDKNTNSFADTPLGEDLYGIYANAQITFSLADEVFMDDYMKYSRDEIGLDEFISEVERKTDIYLNE